MNPCDKLQPTLFWQLFAGICAIPHTSGHEARLRNWIAGEAVKRGLAVKTDPAGNLRIDRPASPGFTGAPTIILQGHLDMVPQKKAGIPFDFITDPIRMKLKGQRLYADNTTLGADDGIGIAAGLSLLFDPEYHCGPLALLATVQEETGLDGARQIAPDMLAGDLLLNLDSEDEGIFCIGCAGGETCHFRFAAKSEPLTGDWTGFRLHLRGLKGGHSGMDIGLNHGNAVMVLVDLLQENPHCRLASFSGGTVDNAIPCEAQADIAVPTPDAEHFFTIVGDFTQSLRKRCDVLPECILELELIPPPAQVWQTTFQQTALTAIHQLPDGVLDAGSGGGPIVTSSNVAIFRAQPQEAEITIHPRSISNAHSRVTRRCRELLAPLSPTVQTAGAYPSWEPQYDSPLLQTAMQLYRELFGNDPEQEVIHAGLECSLFKQHRPDLDMISFGPTVCNVHTAEEYVETETVIKFDRFLRAFLRRLAQPVQ